MKQRYLINRSVFKRRMRIKSLASVVFLIRNFFLFLFGRDFTSIMFHMAGAFMYILFYHLLIQFFNGLLVVWLCFSYFYLITGVIFFIQALVGQKKEKNIHGFGGIIRWDRVLEVHVGALDNPKEFYQRFMKSIKYAQDHHLNVEFISGYRSYGRLIRDFGDAILVIRPLGWLQNLFLSSMTKTFERQGVNLNTRYMHRVVIDPQKLKVVRRKSGALQLQSLIGSSKD